MSTAFYNVAIIGATGMVGSTLLSLLDERQFPIQNLHLLASSRSAGESRLFKQVPHVVEDIAFFDFHRSQICFFCAGNQISAEYAPKAVSMGNIVLDKSSYFRYHPEIPLIVPEVNQQDIQKYAQQNIIARPNCTTIPIAVALKPIYDAVGITRINIATYQSVSGSGKEAMNELTEQSMQILQGQPVTARVYPQQIAFNVLPHIDQFEENGYTREEMKMIWEIQKIFNDPDLKVNPTAVRVPVYYGHSAAVHIETHHKIAASQVIELLKKTPGIQYIHGEFPYPTPVSDAAGKDFVYIGRVREDVSHPKGLNLWIVADNLRKGAALNAVQVAENIVRSCQ